MIIDRRKPRKCRECGEVKKPDDFRKNYGRNKAGDQVIYCRPRCKRCEAEQIGPTKRCHLCYKYKTNDNYRLTIRGRIKVESNWCKDCEAEHGKYSINHEIMNRPRGTLNDIEKTKHHCAWIGKKSYRHICKVFGIRYSKKKLLNERTYKDMRNGS